MNDRGLPAGGGVQRKFLKVEGGGGGDGKVNYRPLGGNVAMSKKKRKEADEMDTSLNFDGCQENQTK